MNQTCDRCGPAVRAGYRIDRVSRASARSCRSNPANSDVPCSAMTAASPPAARSPPAATSTARTGPVPALSRPGARTAMPGTRPARCPGRQLPPRPEPGTGAPGPTAGAVLPVCPGTWSRRLPAPSPAPSCGSRVGRRRAAHTGPRPEQHRRRPERAGGPAAPGTRRGHPAPALRRPRVATLFTGVMIPRGRAA